MTGSGTIANFLDPQTSYATRQHPGAPLPKLGTFQINRKPGCLHGERRLFRLTVRISFRCGLTNRTSGQNNEFTGSLGIRAFRRQCCQDDHVFRVALFHLNSSLVNELRFQVANGSRPGTQIALIPRRKSKRKWFSAYRSKQLQSARDDD